MPDIETPEGDAVEQQQSLRDPESVVPDPETPMEADDGDLAESAREVPLDEDDWR